MLKLDELSGHDSLDNFKIPDFDKASFKKDFVNTVNNVEIVSTDEYE